MTMTALDIARHIADGTVSAMDVLQQTEARILAHDPALNCFTAHTFERARREAAAIDKRCAAGEMLPPLAGVPYAVKNLFDIEGVVTLCGGKLHAGERRAAADAELIVRMQAAGAVLVGALNMDEHAYGFTTENTHYGVTRNPRDPARIAGGSSGGSAAAVAAGLVPLALGSDTNGSIRVPSSLCGIFGLKPTFARLPRTGSYPFVRNLDHLGPFATSVADLAASYDAMQGPDRRDHSCAQRSIELVSGSFVDRQGLRVAVLGGWFRDWAGDAATRAVELAAAVLGATDEVEFKLAGAARAAAFVITGAEGGALHRESLSTRYAEFEPLSRDRLVAGSLIPASWVDQAQRVRRQAYMEMMALFEQFDLLIAPSTPIQAPLIGFDEEVTVRGRALPVRAGMGILTQPISSIGLPVCAVPIRLDDAVGDAIAGLPIGLQLIAAPWREDICLAAAHRLEAAGLTQFADPHFS
jgi:aspartyl-tRNA(Asn)/glutamyl-tRNA(Gln) amidotransferase subunit A